MDDGMAIVPNWQKEQLVSFIGGAGVVRNYRRSGNAWEYLIEMEMGEMPVMGRIGYETMLWLAESELHWA